MKSDGTAVAWGDNTFRQSSVPAGLNQVTAVAAGDTHSLALKTDGTVAAWGNNDRGQATVPAGLSGVTAIAAGSEHNLALKTDGTVVAWGTNFYGETSVPAGLNGVNAIAANGRHSLALTGSDSTPPTIRMSHPANSAGWNRTSPVTETVSAFDAFSGLASISACVDEDGVAETLTAASVPGTWAFTVSGDGSHDVTCSVSDRAGNTGTASDVVRIDTTAPTVTCSASPAKVKPTGKLVSITTTVTVTDEPGGSGAASFTLTSVESNQADSGLARKDRPDDIQDWATGTADTGGMLRAEQFGGDRVYTLTYQGSDLASNTASCQTTVTVAKGK